MNNLNVSIIDEWPYFKIIVKLPNGRIIQDKAVWHIAASQFAPKVQQAFDEAMKELIETNKQRRNVQEPTKA